MLSRCLIEREKKKNNTCRWWRTRAGWWNIPPSSTPPFSSCSCSASVGTGWSTRCNNRILLLLKSNYTFKISIIYTKIIIIHVAQFLCWFLERRDRRVGIQQWMDRQPFPSKHPDHDDALQDSQQDNSGKILQHVLGEFLSGERTRLSFSTVYNNNHIIREEEMWTFSQKMRLCVFQVLSTSFSYFTVLTATKND